MKTLFLLTLFMVLSFSSCQQAKEAEIQLAVAQKALQEAKASLEDANLRIAELSQSSSEALIHTVYIKLVEGISDVDRETVISTLKSLKQIKEVKKIEVGRPADTGDARLKINYDVALLMHFDNLDALAKYQVDPYHVKKREELAQFMAGPPVVYDYRSE